MASLEIFDGRHCSAFVASRFRASNFGLRDVEEISTVATCLTGWWASIETFQSA